jgi:hypothetical protein
LYRDPYVVLTIDNNSDTSTFRLYSQKKEEFAFNTYSQSYDLIKSDQQGKLFLKNNIILGELLSFVKAMLFL